MPPPTGPADAVGRPADGAPRSLRRPQPRLVATVGAVAVGGAIGAIARHGIGVALPHGPDQWPWSTLAINVSGCLLIGALMVVITELREAHPLVRPLLGVGVLGGFTTFSTYAVDAVLLTAGGRLPLALAYVAATPVLAVLAAAAGVAATRALAGPRSHPPGAGGAADPQHGGADRTVGADPHGAAPDKTGPDKTGQGGADR